MKVFFRIRHLIEHEYFVLSYSVSTIVSAACLIYLVPHFSWAGLDLLSG